MCEAFPFFQNDYFYITFNDRNSDNNFVKNDMLNILWLILIISVKTHPFDGRHKQK